MSMNKSKVAEIRKQKSLTQENLAEKAYVTVRTIQRMEAGEEVSSETLKSVSNALDVTVNELFESISSSDKEEEIMEISKEQQKQFNYRKNELFTIKLITFSFIFVFLGLFGIFVGELNGLEQNIYRIIWIFALFLSLAIMYYFLNVFISKKLDKKYPMTIGMKNRNRKNEPVKNGWDFMARYWWIVFPIGGFLSWLIKIQNKRSLARGLKIFCFNLPSLIEVVLKMLFALFLIVDHIHFLFVFHKYVLLTISAFFHD